MKKEKGKFLKEFKKFISKGNVLDLAVGVIIGGAFSSIITSLTNNILKPIINYIILIITGGNSFESAVTYLKKVTNETGNIDIQNSIFINWGDFITSIINFFLIALVLFSIIKIIANMNKKMEETRIKALEDFYKKFPDKRPKIDPIIQEAPKPSELEVLLEIKEILKEK